ncbi:mannose-1-phosphate guanylyltransferase [Arsenicicoccus dermatophilus]|uniref:mannose-1-phosphate guanylyltransferase n=1 Tax=Arsenicicoccus dermatophilus TaxID=1076331 RepID=UPI001F4CF8C4|nr:mannose-1-phosphate guanylyltransferase [Arsenicicoccus dermatophilus]MCH8612251.1 mannose-1-phosphate guanylyltransferase [Arsenicicoccus dermatophilus]
MAPDTASASPAATSSFYCVIPAGGAGTRLWPLSRSGRPKFLHDLTGGGRSMLQATYDRLAPLCDGRVLVVTGAKHEAAVHAQLPEVAAGDVLVEPGPRDSMAAIGLAAAVLELRDPEAVIGSFAADHVITEVDAFHRCVREAVAVAQHDYLVTIGIEPTFPATGFGYVCAGEPLQVTGAPRSQVVSEFVEKPDAGTAAAYLSLGTYRWNAGMFVVKARVLLDVLAEYHPELAAGLRAIAANPWSLNQTWKDLEKIAIDHAVAEPAAAAGRVAVIPGDFGWDDVGDFDSLAGLLPAAGETPDRQNVAVLGSAEQVHIRNASGVVVNRSGRQVVLLGLEDVVVVDTPDVLMVTTRTQAQDVKSIVELVKERGYPELT